MKQLTVKDILNLELCKEYTERRVTELFSGRDTVTLADIVQMDIPAEDIVWVAVNLFNARQRTIFACKCAEDAGMSTRDATWDATWATARATWAAARTTLAATWAAARAARDAARVTLAARDAARAAAEERQLLFICETILETEGEADEQG